MNLKYKKLSDGLFSEALEIKIVRDEPSTDGYVYDQGITLNSKPYSHLLTANDSRIWFVTANVLLTPAKRLFIENLLLTMTGQVEIESEFKDFIIDSASVDNQYLDDNITLRETSFRITFKEQRTGDIA